MATIPFTSLGTPVVSERLTTQALIPDGSGGWIWISQFYTYPNNNPGEWIVANLSSGTYSRQNGGGSWLNKKYASTNYSINNQLFAPNGRVFFGALSTCWYDCTMGVITQHPQLPFLPGENFHDDADYDLIFNVDGSILYGGTIASAGASDHRPQLFAIDPTTDAITQYGRVGSTEHSLAAYAYYVHADGLASPWVYTLVGQDIWDCVATDTMTGTSTILIQGLTSNPWMNFTERPEGLVLNVYTNKNQPSQTLTQYWIVDGVLYPYTFPYNPGDLPFTPRTVTPYTRLLVQPPQISTLLCPVGMQWRPFGSTGSWTELDFSLQYVAPVAIDGMATLEDSSILIIAQEYEGWSRYVPPASQATFLGQGVGVADTCFSAARSQGNVSGYPNGILFEYDLTKAYDKGLTNPIQLGEYSNGDSLSGVKTADLLRYDASNQRLYMAGTRDRSGFGAGIGDYTFTSKIFGGTFVNLSLYTGGLGLAVLGSSIALGGKTSDNSTAHIFLYDLDLTQIDTQTPNATWSDTGRLYPAPDDAAIVVGVSGAEQLAYRWNTATKVLLATVDLAPYGAFSPATLCDNEDGTITFQLGTQLVTLDLTTLVVTSLGDLPGGMTALNGLVTSGGTYYAIIGANFYRLSDEPIDYSLNVDSFDVEISWADVDLEIGTENELNLESFDVDVTWQDVSFGIGTQFFIDTMQVQIFWNASDAIVDSYTAAAQNIVIVISSPGVLTNAFLESIALAGPLRSVFRASQDGIGIIPPGTVLSDEQTQALLLSDNSAAFVGNSKVQRARCLIDPGWAVTAFAEAGRPALQISRIDQASPFAILKIVAN